jgi:hypothetical protein
MSPPNRTTMEHQDAREMRETMRGKANEKKAQETSSTSLGSQVSLFFSFLTPFFLY